MIENPNRIKEKVALIKQQDYNDWYFVVTTKHLVKDYRKFGKVIDSRYLEFQLKEVLKKFQK